LSGYAIYIWHCNRSGEYSLYSSGVLNENYLRGVQVTDSNGQVTLNGQSVLTNNSAFTVLSNGNVGVGTTNPNARLSLGGGVGIKQLVYDDNPDYNSGFGTNLIEAARGQQVFIES